MPRLLLGLFFCILRANAQFSNLATTADGSELIFSSTLQMAGTNQPAWEKLFRIAADGLSLYAERDRIVQPATTLSNQYRLTGADLSGDGRIVAIITEADCVSAGSRCFVETAKYQSEISGPPGQQTVVLRGQVRLSRNGRYGVLCCDGALGSTTLLQDLATNRTRPIPGTIAVRPTVSSTGMTVIPASDGTGNLMVITLDGVREIGTSTRSSQAVVDDSGMNAIYVGTAVDGNSVLARVSLDSGEESVILQQTGIRLVGVSDSGDRIALLGNDGLPAAGDKTVQLFTISSDGTDLHQLTHDPGGVVEAVLAGAGKIAFAVTLTERILRVDVIAGTVTEWIGRTVTVQSPSPSAPYPIAGSAFCVGGTGLADSTVSAAPPLPSQLSGLRLLLDGRPVPIESVAPDQVCFQIPWSVSTGQHTLVAETDSDPHFSGGATNLEMDRPEFISFVRNPAANPASFPLVAHQDFSGLVTPDNPAQPGEILSFYLTGLGPVSPPVETGQPAPASPPAVAVDQPICNLTRLGNPQPTPVDVLFAGLAPGFVGYYQVTIQMPPQLPFAGGQVFFACSASQPYTGESIYLPANYPPQAPQ